MKRVISCGAAASVGIVALMGAAWTCTRPSVATAQQPATAPASEQEEVRPTTRPQTRPASGATADGWSEEKDEPAAPPDGQPKPIGPGGGFGTGSGLGPRVVNDGHGPSAPNVKDISGPKGPVFGHGGDARTIAFVCDASGSMINKMVSLKAQLVNALNGLRPVQAFSLTFMQDERYASLSSGLIFATPENKRKAEKFLEDITTTGQTNPIPAIELAFKQKPQLIYLLTDGDFPDNNAVLAKVRELLKSNKVQINTIAFVSSGDTDTAFLSLLEQISKESGGAFAKVDEEKLGQ